MVGYKMILEFEKDKSSRILSIYSKLMSGQIVNKTVEAQNFNVNERTIQRDIEDIRHHLEQEMIMSGKINEVVYDRTHKGYRLNQVHTMQLTNEEILAISKILLDSRAFRKDEMMSILRRLIGCCVPQHNRKLVDRLLANESFHYIELKHQQSFLANMWEIGQAIQSNQYIEIGYQGTKGTKVKTRKLKPLAIMFSEYYFYLAAFIDDAKVRENFSVLNDAFPTIYRIDRIQSLKVSTEKFHIPYANRFEEGEFRKRIQFMYGGKLRKIKFEYSGFSLEAILDRLPTAKVVDENEGKYVIQAEVFGDGIDMWLKSQGDNVRILENI